MPRGGSRLQTLPVCSYIRELKSLHQTVPVAITQSPSLRHSASDTRIQPLPLLNLTFISLSLSLRRNQFRALFWGGDALGGGQE
jgi:hypothetical protein